MASCNHCRSGKVAPDMRGYSAICSESGTSGEKFPKSRRAVQTAVDPGPTLRSGVPDAGRTTDVATPSPGAIVDVHSMIASAARFDQLKLS